MPPDCETHTTSMTGECGATPGHSCLFVVAGGTPGRHRLPEDGSLVLGRSTEADLVLPDRGVSRRHAVVHCGSALTIEDLGSANGTLVCGRRLAPGEQRALSEGDVVQLARATLIVQAVQDAEHAVVAVDELTARIDRACAASAPCALAVLTVRGPGAASPAVVAAMLGDADAIASPAPGDYEVLLRGAAGHAVARAVDHLRRGGLEAHAGTAIAPRDGRDARALRASARRRLARPDGGLALTEASMRAVHELAERVAGSMLSVLIVGETGVGKDLVAELVHRRSPRAAAPLLCLNCAALPEALLESELFGHERGAFTGATHTKPGLLEVARGGTVFLDEIGELPRALQAKLLRVVESRQILRVGGLEPRSIDVRFLAATHRDLEAEVRAGRFREDLFYRLDGITLRIPPLRERTAEVAELARLFVDEACARTNRRPAPVWSPDALALLLGHRWPGNIRELKNAVERAVVLCTGDVLEVEHLPDALRGSPVAAAPPGEEAALRSRLADLDRRRIAEALDRAGGNQSRAARSLGIARNTLIARMKAYGLDARRA